MHIIAEITYHCPANCSFCPLKNEGSVKTMNLRKFELVLHLFSTYFHNSKRWLLTISGGEPSTVLKLKEYVDIAKEKGYTVTVVTNGWNPEKILEAKPDFVQISLDFLDAKHNMSRKLEVWHKILKLLNYIKEGELKGFIRFTLMDGNLTDLIQLRERLDNLGLNDLKIFAMPIRGTDNSPSREQILKAMKYAILPSRCPAGKGMFVVTPDFRVLDCLFHRQELGRFNKFTLRELGEIVDNGKKIDRYPCGEPYWWAEEG